MKDCVNGRVEEDRDIESHVPTMQMRHTLVHQLQTASGCPDLSGVKQLGSRIPDSTRPREMAIDIVCVMLEVNLCSSMSDYSSIACNIDLHFDGFTRHFKYA